MFHFFCIGVFGEIGLVDDECALVVFVLLEDEFYCRELLPVLELPEHLDVLVVPLLNELALYAAVEHFELIGIELGRGASILADLEGIDEGIVDLGPGDVEFNLKIHGLFLISYFNNCDIKYVYLVN